MGREEQIINERKRKLKELRGMGINPYPHNFDVKNYSEDVKENNNDLEDNEKSRNRVVVAGRIMTVRNLGKLIFATIQDSKGRLQLILQKGETSEEDFKLFKKYVDAGDFVGCKGMVMKTKSGEISVLVKKVQILSKSTLPLPEKFHGLKDEEDRYRKRYLDLAVNPDVKPVFESRSMIIDSLRDFFRSKGFIDVDTPMLQPLYGGGAARPFISKLNTLKMDIYLAISHELYLKRLIVGGFDKVYVMNRVFRNEGIDATHNPEFTILETMWAYVDYNSNMDLFEEMVEYVAKKVLGKTKIKYQGTEIELKRPWKRMSMVESIKKFVKIDVIKMSDSELKSFLKKNKIEIEGGFRRGMAIEEIFGEIVEPKLIQPTIIYDYPADTSPLAKKKEGNPDFCERFEPYINGWEMGNNYTELNEPEELKRVFMEQSEFKKRGDEEAAPYDEDFVNALEIGMPPTSGLGLGVDRLVMLLTDQPSIRDIIFFPFMKPVGMSENKTGKAKDGRIAVAIINDGLKLKGWEKMNTIAHLNASFAARKGDELFMQDTISTKDSKKINLNIRHAIMIKEAKNNEDILDLVEEAKEKELDVSEFTREMIETTDDVKVVEWTKGKNLKDIEYLGALVFGKRSVVEKLTEKFKLVK